MKFITPIYLKEKKTRARKHQLDILEADLRLYKLHLLWQLIDIIWLYGSFDMSGRWPKKDFRGMLVRLSGNEIKMVLCTHQ